MVYVLRLLKAYGPRPMLPARFSTLKFHCGAAEFQTIFVSKEMESKHVRLSVLCGTVRHRLRAAASAGGGLKAGRRCDIERGRIFGLSNLLRVSVGIRSTSDGCTSVLAHEDQRSYVRTFYQKVSKAHKLPVPRS